jgi:hypothetical protein
MRETYLIETKHRKNWRFNTRNETNSISDKFTRPNVSKAVGIDKACIDQTALENF